LRSAMLRCDLFRSGCTTSDDEKLGDHERECRDPTDLRCPQRRSCGGRRAGRNDGPRSARRPPAKARTTSRGARRSGGNLRCGGSRESTTDADPPTTQAEADEKAEVAAPPFPKPPATVPPPSSAEHESARGSPACDSVRSINRPAGPTAIGGRSELKIGGPKPRIPLRGDRDERHGSSARLRAERHRVADERAGERRRSAGVRALTVRVYAHTLANSTAPP